MIAREQDVTFSLKCIPVYTNDVVVLVRRSFRFYGNHVIMAYNENISVFFEHRKRKYFLNLKGL